MFERFTEKAIKVIMLAQEETRRLGHNNVGCESILLGLMGEGSGVAAKSLKGLGCNLKDLRVEVEKIIGRGSGFVSVEIPFTPGGKRTLELAWESARQLGHNFIGTEHLLLGLITEEASTVVYADKDVVKRVLATLCVDLEVLRARVLQMLRELPPDVVEVTGKKAQLSEMPSKLTRACPNCAESIKAAAHVCYYCGYGVADEHFKTCPFCKERIRIDATKCRHCLTLLEQSTS